MNTNKNILKGEDNLSSKKVKTSFVITIMAIIGFITKNQTQANSQQKLSSQKNTNQTQALSNNKINYVLTHHAKCRMKCRGIDKEEINQVLAKGKLNKRKSDPKKRPCPVKSLEGYSQRDSQHIRVVAAYCPDTTKIITVIDLKNKYDCYCK